VKSNIVARARPALWRHIRAGAGKTRKNARKIPHTATNSPHRAPAVGRHSFASSGFFTTFTRHTDCIAFMQERWKFRHSA
jgi:hypothetical protein